MADWMMVRLEELASNEKSSISKPYGSAILKEDYRPVGVPIVRGVNLARGIFHDDDFVFIEDELAKRMPGAEMTAGDLVVTHRGTVGQVSMIPRTSAYERYVASTSHVKVRLDSSKAIPEFYYYWFSSPIGKRSILENASTVGVPGIAQPVATMKRLRVPCPPLSMQRAIAEVLGALDNKITINDRLASAALELAQGLYDQSLKGKPRSPMSKFLNPILGGTPARSDASLWNGSVAWASAKDVTSAEHGVILSTSESITELAASKSRTRALPIGTVVLTARGTVGVVARLGLPAAINQSCYGFVPETIPASCLFFTIKDAANQARSLAHGSVFDTITMNTFEHVQVPTLDQQGWLCVEERVAPILSSSQQAVSESKALTATRDELLPLLMSGKIRLREAEKVVEGVV